MTATINLLAAEHPFTTEIPVTEKTPVEEGDSTVVEFVFPENQEKLAAPGAIVCASINQEIFLYY